MTFQGVPVFIQKLFGSVTWRMPGTGPSLFLTFDDGPHPDITPQILDILKSADAKATFFCVGENVEKYPGIFRRITEDGHVTGNHTQHHLDGWKTGTRQYIADTLHCRDTIRTVANRRSTVELFRPPYGKLKLSQLKALRKEFRIVMWDTLSRDYDQTISGEKCLQNVIRYSGNGSIVVFHDSVKAKDRVLYTLPKVLEHFSKRNFSFLSLSGLQA
jgi:peptidoglycan/xylan/chitin deacetylase (PgdA/CDA1 family)